MKLHDLTGEQKSRWIAEKLEPIAVLSKKRPRPAFLADSTLGCWRGSNEHEWQPRDMLHDPAMTDLLWKEILRAYDLLSAVEMLRQVASNIDDDPEVWNIAVADAFMLANGYIE